MDTLIDALREALNLLTSMDPALLAVVGMTLRVTGGALLMATLIGLPLGAAIGLRDKIPASGCLMPIIYTGMGLPPVVVGLFVYLMLSNQGPLGSLDWLFTPRAMIAAQTIIALPLIIGLTLTALRSLDPGLKLQVRSLGATPAQLAWTLLLEARLGVLAAIIAAFGGIISEVGAVMLVGGNIEGQTRVLTTAIVLETRRGNFALALALGIILLALDVAARRLQLTRRDWARLGERIRNYELRIRDETEVAEPERAEGMAQLLRAKEKRAEELQAASYELRVTNEAPPAVDSPAAREESARPSDAPEEAESLAARLRKRRQV